MKIELLMIYRYILHIVIIKMSIIIQKINSETLDWNKINNCNLDKDSDDIDAQNKDYRTETKKTHLLNYANLINYPVKFTYEFTIQEINYLKEACHVGIITGNWPSIYKEEIDEVLERLKINWIEGQYFIRFDSASPKDGTVEFPITNPESVIMALITSKRALTSLNIGYNKLYFMDYDPDFDNRKEVRVFVKSNKVTCISQYDSYRSGYFNQFTDENLTTITKNIVNEVENNLIPLISNNIKTTDFTVDYLVKRDLSIKIIELNSFGYWLSAGSCLFSWKTDREIMYDKENKQNVYFRILV